LPEDWWERVKPGTVDECWEWLGGASHCYGMCRWEGRWQKAVRVIWGVVHGPVGPTHCVFHTCGNTMCVNPAHLVVGSRGDYWQQRRRAKWASDPPWGKSP